MAGKRGGSFVPGRPGDHLQALPLSDLSYLLILIYLSGHEWGAEYKYSDVPLGEWMKPWLHTTRNHYDRIMHFSYGLLLAYPMQEWFMRVVGVTSRWRYLLPVEMTLAFSACYEMLEALAASVLTPERGEEFVGMQGDIWDSQKDMLMAGLGAVTAMIVIATIRTVRKPPPEGTRVPGSRGGRRLHRPIQTKVIRLELGASVDPLRVGVDRGPGLIAGREILERDEVGKILAVGVL